ncbi:hypothetical protein KKB83_04155 [Patescibacteria group bacterium]|nr:hypothetical protein [Patescibacteria group bacterium]
MNPVGFFNQTITVATKTANNRYGRATFGTGTDQNARFQKKNKEKLLPNGQLVTIEAIVYCKGSLSININDKITYGSDNYKVYSKSEAIDGEGNINHLKLELIKWLETST